MATEKKETPQTKFDEDYRGELSPFRTKIGPNGKFDSIEDSTSQRSAQNYFTLSDYVWYPEDTKRWFNKDYSMAAINTPALDNNIGIFGNVSISGMTSKSFTKDNISKALGTIKNKTIDYAKSQADGVISSIKNTISGKSTEELPSTDYFNTYITHNIPKIIISEFQPNNEITSAISKLGTIFKTAEQFFSGGNMGAVLGKMFSTEGMAVLLKNIMGDDLKDVKDIDTVKGKLITIPNWFYTHMIGGYFTAKYEVPYLDKQNYLNGQGSEGWTARSLKSKMLGPLADIAKKFSGDTLNAFDIAAKPKWQLDGSGPTYENITCELTLFNYDEEALWKNFKLIHTLIPGNMWYQSVLLQKSSCLYDIEIPGRMRFYLCKADMSATFEGKQRRAPEIFRKRVAQMSALGYSMNESAIFNVPDAYKITMTFTPLVPNNFNMYMNYFMKDINDSVGSSPGNVRHDAESSMINAVALTQAEMQNRVAQENGDI